MESASSCISLYYLGGWARAVRECYEDAKTLSKLRTKSYYISGGRDEVIEYIKKTEMESLSVYDVKASKWE